LIYNEKFTGAEPRVYRVTATLDASVAEVADLISDIDNIGRWNRAVQVP